VGGVELPHLMLEHRPIELIAFAALIFAAGFIAAEAAGVLGMIKTYGGLEAAMRREGDED
jgi:hypothetical protein